MRHRNYKFLNLEPLLTVCCGAILSCNIATAQDLPVDASTITQSKQTIQFIAPQGAMPIARVGGGIRGTDGGNIVFTVLAPKETGLTTQAQPTLYWYQSEPATDMEFELTLNLEDETLLEIRLSKATNTGVQELDLAALNISLEPEQPYEWIVALIPDPDDRAMDITSSTFIRFIEPADDLQKRLQQANPVKNAHLYAEAGIWYDAFESLARAIESTPNDKAPILDRIQLFEQAGLENVAELERKRINL